MSKLISKIVVPDSNEATGYSLYNVKDSGAIHSSDVGVAGGVASLDNAGKVPSSQLPSYVDDVVEGYYHENKFYTTYTPGQEEEDPGTYSGEITAETGKIYVDIPTNQSYRWSGSAYIVISSPYVLPTASANTLGGVKVGDNLSIDQNGVLSAQASSPDEVQIGGNTPSSDSDIKIFIDTTEDAVAEVYTKQLQDGKFIVIKDLNTAPTESTLTYTENGTVKNFKVGDEVRVPDAEADNGYTFYKLYELTTSGNTTTAVWDKLGAGEGGGNAYEIVSVTLTTDQGSEYDSDLIGATITIVNNTDSETLYTTTWNGSAVEFEIPVPITYSVVGGNNVENYDAPLEQLFTSRTGRTRQVTLEYGLLGDGIFAITTTGKLATQNNIDTANPSKYVGVAVRDSSKNMFFFIDKRLPIGNAISANVGNYKCFAYNMTGYDYSYLTNITEDGGSGSTAEDHGSEAFRTLVMQMYNNGETGIVNTNNLVADSNHSSHDASNNAAKYCRSIANPITGEYNGYLGCAAEYLVIVDNLALVNTLLLNIGGVKYTAEAVLATTNRAWFLTSSETGYHDESLFINSAASGQYPCFNVINKSDQREQSYVRPFFPLS